MNTPRLRGLRSAFANPLAGGDAGGPAEPVPRRLLEGIVRASWVGVVLPPLPLGEGWGEGLCAEKLIVKWDSGAYSESASSYQLMSAT